MLVPKYIRKIYNNYTGFKLKLTDNNDNTVAHTYGEILPESVSEMIKNINIDNNDVFYDLGSGIGKVPTQFYLETPVKKSVGIEYNESRNNIAKIISSEIKNNFKSKYKKLELINDNFFNVDTTDGTIFYLCSTCFNDSVMNQLFEKIISSPNLKAIISLKPFPNIIHDKVIKLPMTWNKSGSLCHFYFS